MKSRNEYIYSRRHSLGKSKTRDSRSSETEIWINRFIYYNKYRRISANQSQVNTEVQNNSKMVDYRNI